VKGLKNEIRIRNRKWEQQIIKKKKFEMKLMQCCDSEVKLGLVADQKS
jgi:hypothetical protein